MFLLLEQLTEEVGDEALVISYNREDGGKTSEWYMVKYK